MQLNTTINNSINHPPFCDARMQFNQVTASPMPPESHEFQSQLVHKKITDICILLAKTCWKNLAHVFTHLVTQFCLVI
jgi:hypothetical protein